MPVTLVTGSPGSGKSYFCVRKFILENIRKKRLVITNIRLFEDKLTEEQRRYYRFENPLYYTDRAQPLFSMPCDYMDTWRDENGNAPIYVIDECQKILSRSAKPSKELIEFYQEHRHYGEIDIVLVTQGQRYIDDTIKELIEDHWFIQKAGILKKGHFQLRYYMGIRERDRSKPPVLKKLEKYEQEVFDLYKSHTQSETEVKRDNTLKAPNKMKWLKYAALSILILFLYISYKSFSAFSGMGGTSVVDEPPAESEQGVTTIVPAAVETTVEDFVGPIKQATDDKKLFKDQTYEYKNVNYRPDFPKRDKLNVEQVKHSPFFNHSISVAAYIESDSKFLAYFEIVTPRGTRLKQSHLEMIKAGYSITFLNSCLALLDHEYEQNPFYVTCESLDNGVRRNVEIPNEYNK